LDYNLLFQNALEAAGFEVAFGHALQAEVRELSCCPPYDGVFPALVLGTQ
jgi:hypothetical protein